MSGLMCASNFTTYKLMVLLLQYWENRYIRVVLWSVRLLEA